MQLKVIIFCASEDLFCWPLFFNALQEIVGSASVSTDPLRKHVKLDHSAVVEAPSAACVSGYHGDA